MAAGGAEGDEDAGAEPARRQGVGRRRRRPGGAESAPGRRPAGRRRRAEKRRQTEERRQTTRRQGHPVQQEVK